MYQKQIAQKASPSLRSMPKSQDILPSQSCGSLSEVVQRVQQDPNSVSGDERQQLESAIGTRSMREILAGKQTPWVPEFQGISAQLGAPIQAKRMDDVGISQAQPENKTGLPDHLKAGIENLSGMAMDDVSVHYNSSKPSELQALAYTQGTDIHVAPGQEKHLPHEAWHVVQQKQNRVKPSLQMKSGIDINDSPQLENEANVMGAKAQSIGDTVQQKAELTQLPRIKSNIISGASQQLKSHPAVNGCVIQKVDSHDTWGGNFTVERYEPIVERSDGTSIGADIRIVFTPNQNCPKNVTIGLIQIVKLSEGSSPSSHLQGKLLRQSGPWAVDRAEDSNPVYGSYDDDHKAQSLTDNAPNSREGNQFARRGKGGQPATLEDTPILPLYTDIKQGQYFETTAVVLEGAQKGLALGTVGWGWTKPAGEKKAVCEEFTLITNSGSTANFEQAKEAWNALSKKEGLVEIPDISAAPAPKKGKCFLTTACVEYMGLSDDCEELTSLRQFRDSYLVKKHNGQELIKLYYEYSPRIVAAIHQKDNHKEILERLYKVIRQCVDAIKKADNEWAYQTYCTMVMELKDEFIPECEVPTIAY